MLKNTGVRGDEATGTEEAWGNVGRTAADIGAGLVKGGIKLVQSALEKRQQRQQMPPELKGDFRQDLYQAFLEKGVPEETASEAADAVMLGKDAANSPALAEAHKVVEESQFEQDETSSQKSASVESVSASQPAEDSQKKPSVEEIQESSEEATASDSPEKVSAQAISPQSGEQAQGQAEASSTSEVVETVESEKTEAQSNPIAAQASATTLPIDLQSDESPAQAQLEETPSQAAVDEVSTEKIEAQKSNPVAAQADTASVNNKKVEISQKPSEMDWKKLQQTARDITAETGDKPAGRKKPQILDFVESYAEQQNKSSAERELAQTAKKTQYASAVVTPAVVRTPVVQPNPSLEDSYNAGLKAAEVDDKTAKGAATALVSGQGADTSTAIRDANKQVQQKAKPAAAVQRSALQQLYFDVLSKQGIKSDLAELASTDLASGKGAHSSKSVRQAHKTILDKELETTGGSTIQEQNWQKHSRYVTEKDPRKRDQEIARNASKAGVPKKRVENMLRMHSPTVARIQASEGSNKAISYFQGVASEASFMTKKAQKVSKSTSAGRQAVGLKPKKKGVEV